MSTFNSSLDWYQLIFSLIHVAISVHWVVLCYTLDIWGWGDARPGLPSAVRWMVVRCPLAILFWTPKILVCLIVTFQRSPLVASCIIFRI